MAPYFQYDPDTKTPLLSVRLPIEQLNALDEARMKVRLNRSEFVRRLISAHIEQVRTTKN